MLKVNNYRKLGYKRRVIARMQKVLKLDNGLVIAADEMEGIETVTVSVLVKVGSRYEPKIINGISHFLEHMAFKGTKTRTARQIAEEFDMIGGYFNAYTSREKTVYYAKVLREDLLVAVNILADILQNSIFEEEEIEKERKVIIQEIAQTEDTPDDLVFDYFQEKAYPDQPFGSSILGTVSSISALTRPDIVNYVKEHYASDRIIIAAAGNFDSNYFFKIVEEKFNSFTKSNNITMDQASYKGGDCRIDKNLEQVHVVLGFKGVSYLHEDYYTQQVMTIISGGGMSSRLFQEVREKRGLAYSISSFGSSYNDCGMVGVYSGTTDNNLNELVDVVFEELYKLTQKITEEELDRARAQVRAALLMSQESSVSRAEKLASNLASYGRYIPITEIIEKINLVTPEKVINFVQGIFSQQALPTIASIGKIDKLYNYEDILQKLKF